MDGLTTEQVDRFVDEGFVHLAGAFPREVADAGRALLWERTGCDPHDRGTWTRPVIRLGGYSDEPFRAAATTPVLHAAFDRLVGDGRWVPLQGLGTWPVRFPHDDDPGDEGWHVEGSIPVGDGVGLNVRSDGTARSCTRPARPGTSTSATRSSCTQRNHTGARSRSSWLNLR